MELSQVESEMFPSDKSWESHASYGGFVLLHPGTYADTYRAQKAGRYFLLKTPRGGNALFLQMLKREYEISVGFDHPNIASAFTFEVVNPLGPCLVMPYIDGTNLTTFLTSKPSVKVRKKILRQLFSAVSYIHRRGIVHNDLKPENIQISRQEQNLKLIDFGLSDDDAHYLAKTLGCTPTFASPELLAHNGPVDIRSDIYSLGKLMLRLFPIRYASVARKCMRHTPSRRYRSVEAIAHAIAIRKVINLVVAALLVLSAAALCLLPDFLVEKTYKADIATAHQRFADACTVAEVSADDIPFVSQSTYVAWGDRRAQRQDSLSAMIDREVADRIVWKQGLEQLNSLFLSYTQSVSAQPYRLFATRLVPRYAQQYNAIRDQRLPLFQQESYREQFFTYCNNRWEHDGDSIRRQAVALPTFTGLSSNEIRFYLRLAQDGKPYTPYRK